MRSDKGRGQTREDKEVEVVHEESAEESAGQGDSSDEEDLRSLLRSVSALRVSSDGLVFHEDEKGNQSWATRRLRSRSRSAEEEQLPSQAQGLMHDEFDEGALSAPEANYSSGSRLEQASTHCPSAELSNLSDDESRPAAFQPASKEVRSIKAPRSANMRRTFPREGLTVNLTKKAGGTRSVQTTCQVESPATSSTRKAFYWMSPRALEVQALQAELAVQEVQLQQLLNTRPGEEICDEVAFEAARLWRGLDTVRAEIASLRESLTAEELGEEWELEEGGGKSQGTPRRPGPTGSRNLSSSWEPPRATSSCRGPCATAARPATREKVVPPMSSQAGPSRSGTNSTKRTVRSSPQLHTPTSPLTSTRQPLATQSGRGRGARLEDKEARAAHAAKYCSRRPDF
mmetsp:Transcript_70775/g.124871  ORF Transcript_70775/g.124871 Transcript_70775/m.124871 type:complete len:401 (-) Transcript_70775:50-1252(-)